MLRKVATGIAGTGAVGAAAFYAADPTAAGRTYVLWTEMAPVVVRYRALEQKQKLRASWTGQKDAALEDREWEALHAVHAKPTVEVMRRMLGSYVKLGQFLALRPDVCPEAWTKELRTLETAVPAQATELVRATICEAYGVERVEDVFATFDDKPVGSASIGQVHRATLKDGRQVAVKVQYGAANEEVMRSDIRNGKLAFRLLAPEQVAVLDEVEAQFATEFDYRREAQNLAEIRANLATAGLLRRGCVAVPEPLPELCTKEVLVMEFLAGENLVDGIRELGERAARRRGVSFDELVAETRASFDRDGYPAPYEGPGPRAVEAYRRLDVARCFFANALAKAGLAKPREPMLGGLNPARVMKTLCAVHGHELLVDGVFNGDPHAGNFLLMPDGTVGCIDYGQVKRLTTAERHWLCRCYIALARGDDAKLRELADLVGMKSRYMLDITRQKMLTFALDRDGRDVTDGLNFQQFLDKMYAQDPWDEVVPMIIMPSRLCIFLRGIGLMMHHPISCTREFLPIAERVLRDEGVDY